MNQNQNKLKASVALLRIFIGWHFLFEGVVKMYNPEWTSFGYLATAQGPFEGFFTMLLRCSAHAKQVHLNVMLLCFKR